MATPASSPPSTVLTSYKDDFNDPRKSTVNVPPVVDHCANTTSVICQSKFHRRPIHFLYQGRSIHSLAPSGYFNLDIMG